MNKHPGFWKQLKALLLVAFVLAAVSSTALAQDAGTAKTWRFAVVCDTRGENVFESGKPGVNERVLAAIAQAIAADKPDLLLFPGDLVNGLQLSEKTPFPVQLGNWRKAMAPVYDAGIAVYPVRGNHETGIERYTYPWPPVHPLPPLKLDPGMEADYRAFVAAPPLPQNGPQGEQGLTYTVAHENALFVALDNYSTVHRVNQPWLDKTLAAVGTGHVFVFGHDPAFRVGHVDSLAYFPAERDRFWDSLGRAGVRLYFCGHDHYYDRAEVRDSQGNAIQQVLVGSGGAPLREGPQQYAEGPKVVRKFQNDKDYGYLLVSVTGNAVRGEWKAWNGKGAPVWQVLDTFSYTLPAR